MPQGLLYWVGMSQMKHLIVVLNAFLFCIAAAAQKTDFDKVEIKVAKVSGNVYMLQGQGGNIAALVGEEGIAIVDDQFAPLAEKIATALKMLGVTNKPVRYVINTHYHGDHTGGNAHFSKTATIIAHENVRKRLKDGTRVGKPASNDALPIITFKEGVTVHLNGEDVRAIHFPPGHTDGDSVVYFVKANVVHTGDNFVAGFPFIDVEGGGSLQGLVANIEKLIKELPTDAKIIPGHGPISSLSDVETFLKMLKDTQSVVKKELDRGQTLQQMQKAKVLAPWDSYGTGFIKSDKMIETIVYSLKNVKKGPLVKH